MSSETQTVDESENTHANASVDNGELSALRQEIEELKQLNKAFLEKNTPKEQQPDLAEIYKTNPVKAMEIIANQMVNAKAGTLGKEQQKITFDNRAENEFPQIKSDPEFQKLVKANIQEMVSSGEMDVNAPKLVYRAAQIAALKYKPKASSKPAQGSNASSEAPSTVTPSKKSGNDSQFDAMAKMFGIKNVDKMRERWDAHKGGKK